jgi:hypothetical protein
MLSLGGPTLKKIIATIDIPHSVMTGPPGIVKFDNEGIAYSIIKKLLSLPDLDEEERPTGIFRTPY